MAAASGDIAVNRKALHEYHILEKLEAGVELKGTEVKSVREGRINLRDAFARVDGGQCLLYGCDIQPYEKASWEQHDPRRVRRLLLHRKEIMRLYGICQVKGHALVALRAYWKGPRVKIELAVARGKDAGDKREALKGKEAKREMEREAARFNRRK
ncbi:MAG: SsrA-binding protein SmpB [Verrucomicrobiota bacterium]|jgi:SsrA-binding protein